MDPLSVLRRAALLLCALAFTAAPASAAVSTTCVGKPDPLTDVTLVVTNSDGSVHSADGSGYMACVFRNGPEGYSIVIAKDDGMEDLGAENLDRTFTLGFSLAAGESATSAELYADVQRYTIGENGRDITLALKPVAVTSGTDGDDPSPLQDNSSSVIGGIRFNTSGSPAHGIVGMWIGASANRYSVDLSGSCPSWQSGAPSGSSTPGSIAVRLWAPHLTAGTLAPVTTNTGSLKAFIPGAIASACFGGASVLDIVAALEVARSEATEGTTALSPGSQFTASAVNDGLLITVPTVTFSSPTYRISAPTAAAKPPVLPISPTTTSVEPTPAQTPTTPTTVTNAPAARPLAVAKRNGRNAVVKITVPAGLTGKTVLITEKVGGKVKTLLKRGGKSGVTAFTVKLTGKKGKAKLKVSLDGKLVAAFTL